MSRFQQALRLLAVVLPQSLKRLYMRHVLGWDIAGDAYVGLSYIGAESVTLGPGSRIGHFNVVRNIRVLELGRQGYIKDLNDIFGCTPYGEYGERAFRLGDRAHVMSRHFFEVGGAITLGEDVVIGGRGTQIYTHSVITSTGVPHWKVGEMNIGSGARIYASTILIHCTIPPNAIVVAGAVLTKSYDPEPDVRLVLGGNPAKIIARHPLEPQSSAAAAAANG